MRYLHHVSANEKFIASGTYQQYKGGQPTHYQEHWTMHEVGEGARLIRIDQDSRCAGAWSRLAEVLLSAEERVERVTLLFAQSGADKPYHLLRTDYIFMDAYVQVTRRMDDQEPDYTEIPTPPGVFVRLLDFTLLWGKALLRSAAGDAASLPVFVLFHKPGMPAGQVVTGMLPEIKAQEAEMLTWGQAAVAAMRYRTRGDRVIWLNEQGIPLKITHGRGGDQSDLLINYAHR